LNFPSYIFINKYLKRKLSVKNSKKIHPANGHNEELKGSEKGASPPNKGETVNYSAILGRIVRDKKTSPVIFHSKV
jgi:hypothetical protein